MDMSSVWAYVLYMKTTNRASQIIALAYLAKTRPEIAFVLRVCGLGAAVKLYLSGSEVA